MFQLECRSFVFPKSSQLYQGRTEASLHQQPSCREATVLTWAPPCCWHSTQIQNETCRSCMKCFSFNSKETVKSSSSKTLPVIIMLCFVLSVDCDYCLPSWASELLRSDGHDDTALVTQVLYMCLFSTTSSTGNNYSHAITWVSWTSFIV